LAIGNAAVLAAACAITALAFSPRSEDVAVRELAISPAASR
jgi:two-component system sensor histidine kinase UhpB